MENIAALCTTVVGKILLAIIVFIVGKWVIKKLVAGFTKAGFLKNADPTIARFAENAVKWLLFLVLAVAIIGILGIPMASVVAVIGAAGSFSVDAGLCRSGLYAERQKICNKSRRQDRRPCRYC